MKISFARRGLAAPVGLLLILFSLTMLSTVAYHYSIAQIYSRKEDLKLVASEEKMLDLENAISYLAWSPGAIKTVAFSDYGGQLHIEPEENLLGINVTIGSSNYKVFNSTTGQFHYDLPRTVAGHLGRWLKGDSRQIVNQSISHQAQMFVVTGDDHQELIARYRPLLSSSVGGLSSNRRINNVRIYIINLNDSQTLQLSGDFYVKVICEKVTSQIRLFNTSESYIGVAATIDGSSRTLQVPLTSGSSGSTVAVEIVVSHVKIDEVEI